MNKINSLLELVYVTRLDIDCRQMSANTFIQILMLLRNIDMIRITSLLASSELFMLNGNKEMFNIFINSNKITKLSLLNTSAIDQIDFVIDSFLHLQSFAIEIIDNDILEATVQYILEKIKKDNIRHLTSCCFLTVDATNDKAKTIQQMIDSENLLKDYILYRQCENFYLQWN